MSTDSSAAKYYQVTSMDGKFVIIYEGHTQTMPDMRVYNNGKLVGTIVLKDAEGWVAPLVALSAAHQLEGESPEVVDKVITQWPNYFPKPRLVIR